jgi:hypothetical protein
VVGTGVLRGGRGWGREVGERDGSDRERGEGRAKRVVNCRERGE